MHRAADAADPNAIEPGFALASAMKS